MMVDEQRFRSVERAEADTGVAPNESAVAEPEIEGAESSEEKPAIKPDQSAAAEGHSSEEGCPITMGNIGHLAGPKCGRKLHVAPDSVEEFPVCLMHSKDPKKQSAPLFGEFWREFERIRKAQGRARGSLRSLCFPAILFRHEDIQGDLPLSFCDLHQYSIFSEARFWRVQTSPVQPSRSTQTSTARPSRRTQISLARPSRRAQISAMRPLRRAQISVKRPSRSQHVLPRRNFKERPIGGAAAFSTKLNFDVRSFTHR